MKRYLILLALLAGGYVAYSQTNQIPLIANLHAEVLPDKKQVVVTYDLSDPEDQKIKVILRISDDGGNTYRINTSRSSGDVGPNVKPGRGKKVIWSYTDSIQQVEKLKIKLIADDLYKIDLKDLVRQVDSVRMRADLEYVFGMRSLQNKLSLRHLEDVRKYIAGTFSVNDLQGSYQSAQLKNRTLFRNVAGRLPGHDTEDVTYILGVHIDTSTQSDGADDNGSGITGMLEAVRILSRYNFDRSIRFIGFDGQAIDYAGSTFYARKGIKEFERIACVVDLDMIGFYNSAPNSQVVPPGFDVLFPDAVEQIRKNNSRGDFIINTYNTASTEFGSSFEKNAKANVPDLRVISLEAPDDGVGTPELIASDHYPFWKNGIPALHLGDGGLTRNPDMKKDRLDDLNFTFMSNVTKATIATLAELAGIQHSQIKYCDVTVTSAFKK